MFPEPAEVPTQAGRHAEKQDIQYVAHTYRHSVEKHEEATWKETTFWSFIRWPYLPKCFQTQRLFKCSIVLRDNVLHHSILTIYTAKTVATRLRGPFHLTQSIPNFQFSKHFNDTIHNSRWWLAADLLPHWSVLNERWRNMTDECCSYISSPLFLSASSSLSYIYSSYHIIIVSAQFPRQFRAYVLPCVFLQEANRWRTFWEQAQEQVHGRKEGTTGGPGCSHADFL